MFQNKINIVKVAFIIGSILCQSRQIEGKVSRDPTCPFEENFFTPQKDKLNYEMFDLQNKIPQAEDAQQIFIENPEMTYVGIYDIYTQEITIMPALPKNLFVSYDENNEITKVSIEINGAKLSADEVRSLNEKRRLFIPRYGLMPHRSSDWFCGHKIMLQNMGIPLCDASVIANMIYALFNEHPYVPFYGFAVSRNRDSIEFYRKASINAVGKFTLSTNIPLPLQEKIEKTFKEWLDSNEKSESAQCLLPSH